MLSGMDGSKSSLITTSRHGLTGWITSGEYQAFLQLLFMVWGGGGDVNLNINANSLISPDVMTHHQ